MGEERPLRPRRPDRHEERGRVILPSATQAQLRQLGRLLAYAKPYWMLIALTIGFSFVYAFLLTGRAYLVAPLFDGVILPAAQVSSLSDAIEGASAQEDVAAVREQREALEKRVEEGWRFLVLGATMLVLLMPPARLIRDYTGEWIMTRVLIDLQGDLSSKLLRLPLSHHLREGRGDFVSRALNDTTTANRAQALVFGEAIQDVVIVIAAGGAVFWINWRLALVALIAGPPVVVVLQAFGARIRRTSRRRQEQIAEVVGRLVQMLSGIKVIKAFRAERREQEAFDRELHRYFRRAMGVIRNRVMSRTLVELVTQASFVSLMLVGLWAVVGGHWSISPGQLGAFVFISGMVYRPMKNLTRLYNSIHDALPAAERLFEVIDAPAEPRDPPDAIALEHLERGIVFRDVCFDYDREAVLDGLNLEIAAGEVVALVGRTGSGKTTLADLLLRLHDPDGGTIELDGIDLRRIRRTSLRDLIAVVTQESFLFNTTIFENIRYARPDADFDEVVEAARAANAHDFISELPQGYETEVGDVGMRLSGGQRQRVTIARAILRNPEILIFDEATSALDAMAEHQVQEAIDNLLKGRTVLVIAHRLSTVRSADRIAVLEGGRIVATGTHEELRAREGLYRKLADLQLQTSS